jgi:hypothetical protein
MSVYSAPLFVEHFAGKLRRLQSFDSVSHPHLTPAVDLFVFFATLKFEILEQNRGTWRIESGLNNCV